MLHLITPLEAMLLSVCIVPAFIGSWIAALAVALDWDV